MYSATIIIHAHDQAALDRLYRHLIAALRAHPAAAGADFRGWCQRATAQQLYEQFQSVDRLWALEDATLQTPGGPQPADSRAAQIIIGGQGPGTRGQGSAVSLRPPTPDPRPL
ncbi:MAG: hypothetical protein HY331_15850, partial [Chloroflexi bacterium]|nr:hypothetical protein [Chloroflexota bacterium]